MPKQSRPVAFAGVGRGKNERTPRSNADAAEYWARSILENAPRPNETVNSVIVSRDSVYSFGYHFPMGVIERDKSGRAIRVYTNADHYPHRGFADTPGDLWNVRLAARDAVSKAGWKIELREVLLTHYQGNSSGEKPIRVKPKAGDPEPPSGAHIEVVRPFVTTNPGPAPVKPAEGCTAGYVESYVFETDDRLWSWSDPPLPQLHVISAGRRDHNGDPVRLDIRANLGEIRHVAEPHHHWTTEREFSEGGVTITERQCKHCAAHDRATRDWTIRMEGEPYQRNSRGWLDYAENIERYGSMEEWREAYRADWRRVVAARKAHKAWVSRNEIPWGAVSSKGNIPNLDPDGHPLRKDEEAHWRSVRAAERRERRREREHEKHLRYQRSLERFKRGLARKREPHMKFEDRAATVARDLANLRVRIDANGKTGVQ